MSLKVVEEPSDVDCAIGARIRARRIYLRLSQTDLAEKIGVSFQQVQKYERGLNRVAGSKLVAIAGALQTSVGSLVGEDVAPRMGDEVFAALAMPGALELLRAYAAEPSPRVRSALLALVQEMTESRR
jgi:transcriptional regulator with XRE-family HTH domain